MFSPWTTEGLKLWVKAMLLKLGRLNVNLLLVYFKKKIVPHLHTICSFKLQAALLLCIELL